VKLVIVRNILLGLISVCALLCPLTAQETDWTIKQRASMPYDKGHPYSSVTYIHGAQRRQDTFDGSGKVIYSAIYSCDNHQIINLDHQARVYSTYSWPGTATTQAASLRPNNGSNPQRAGGKQHITITTVDTGERKQVLGHTARHVIITRKVVADANACRPFEEETETEGWYIDAPTLSCEKNARYTYVTLAATGNKNCSDQVEVENHGAPETGLPVAVIIRSHTHSPSVDSTVRQTQEVFELSNAPLDRSIFEIPAGYAEEGSIWAWFHRLLARHR
jgi:hypothetical protein